MIKPTIDDLERQYEAFEKELSKYLALIEKMGARMVEMQTAILYRRVVGEECDTIKMLLCLRVMKDRMLPGDEIVDEPDDFDGRYLKVRFQLPRKSHKKKKYNKIIGLNHFSLSRKMTGNSTFGKVMT